MGVESNEVRYCVVERGTNALELPTRRRTARREEDAAAAENFMMMAELIMGERALGKK